MESGAFKLKIQQALKPAGDIVNALDVATINTKELLEKTKMKEATFYRHLNQMIKYRIITVKGRVKAKTKRVRLVSVSEMFLKELNIYPELKVEVLILRMILKDKMGLII